MRIVQHDIITIILMLALSGCLADGYGQTDDAAISPDYRINWRGDTEAFLDEQARISLEMAGHILERFGPDKIHSEKRTMALLLIDNVFHDARAPHRKPVQDFFRHRIKQAVEQIHATEVTEGAMIWKLYSHGFVVKTPSVTLGFDIVTARNIRNREEPRIDGVVARGIDGFVLEDQVVQDLIDAVDILFVSHRHLDHADDQVVLRFLEQGKPVLAPSDVWEEEPFHDSILHLERKVHAIQEVYLPVKQKALGVVNYPGYQGRVPNNVVLVYTPEGLVLAHTGDQNHEESFYWIDDVGNHHDVDILMLHCDFHVNRMIRGFRPALAIAGHENELGHPVETRHPHWMNPVKFSGHSTPWLQMAWGERFHYLQSSAGQQN